MRLIAYRYYTWVWIRYPTRIVLLFTNIINYIFLCVLLKSPRSVHWAYNIHLVVFELCVAFIQVEYVIGIVYSEYAVRRIPMDVERLCVVPHHALDEENKDQKSPRRVPQAEIR